MSTKTTYPDTQGADPKWDATKDNNNLCRGCYEMTGTAEGMRALMNDGYRHPNELRRSWRADDITLLDPLRPENNPCPLCSLIAYRVRRYHSYKWRFPDGGPSPQVVVKAIKSSARPRDDNSVTEAGRPHRLELDGVSYRVQWDGLQISLPGVRVGYYGGFYQSLRLFAFDEDGSKRRAELSLVTFESNCASDLIPGRPGSKKLTPTVVSSICRELDDCLESHKDCPRRRLPKLPRRILDLGSPDETLASLRLYQPEEGEAAEYVALSYCWGQDQELTTNISTLSSHLKAIPKSRLPKTISDAIAVCRRLGFRFLWVDALCIVQDDEKDKVHDITKMVDIYQNSTLTIIAACAEKVTEGFLSDHDESSLLTQLPLYINSSTSGTIFVRRSHPDHDYVLGDLPLFLRAWAFQEYMLPPRALVFDSTQISWKCRTFRHNLRPVLPTLMRAKGPEWSRSKSLFGLLPYDPKAQRDMYWRDMDWHAIVEQYSRRKLRYFSDRLSALAGVAAAFGKSRDDTYIAGMWTGSLVNCLCWKRYESETVVDPEDYAKHAPVVPSWSWASCNYPIIFREIHNPDAKLVSWAVSLVSEDSPYGPVRRASITLEVKLMKPPTALVELYQRSSEVLVLDSPSPALEWGKLVLEWGKLVLAYIGNDMLGHSFLILEKLPVNTFRRMGTFESSFRTRQIELLINWVDLLSEAKRETIVIE